MLRSPFSTERTPLIRISTGCTMRREVSHANTRPNKTAKEVVLIGVLGGYILQFLAGVGPHRSDQAQPVLEGDAASEPVVVHLTQNLVQRDVEVGDALLFRVQFVGLQSAESRESDCEREQ